MVGPGTVVELNSVESTQITDSTVRTVFYLQENTVSVEKFVFTATAKCVQYNVHVRTVQYISFV